MVPLSRGYFPSSIYHNAAAEDTLPTSTTAPIPSCGPAGPWPCPRSLLPAPSWLPAGPMCVQVLQAFSGRSSSTPSLPAALPSHLLTHQLSSAYPGPIREPAYPLREPSASQRNSQVGLLHQPIRFLGAPPTYARSPRGQQAPIDLHSSTCVRPSEGTWGTVP